MWSKAAVGPRQSVSPPPGVPISLAHGKAYPFDSLQDSRRIGTMSEIIKPSVQAFLVCDQVIEDSVTKKKSLIGLFTHLQAMSFPFQHQQMGLYFCLTDAEGNYQFGEHDTSDQAGQSGVEAGKATITSSICPARITCSTSASWPRRGG